MASCFLLYVPQIHILAPPKVPPFKCQLCSKRFQNLLITKPSTHNFTIRSSIDGGAGGENEHQETLKPGRRGRKKKDDAHPTAPTPNKTTSSTKRPKDKTAAVKEVKEEGEEEKFDTEAPKISRRGRKKKNETSIASTDAKKTTRSIESPREPNEVEEEHQQQEVIAKKIGNEESEWEEDFDDGMDFPYESPPLVCCFGAAQMEFVPMVRVSPHQAHPDKYSTWKTLQWNPPEFVRAPGGPPSNVAISHVRLGGRAAFMGKVGDDEYGNDLVYKLNMERVQTRAVKIDPTVKTATAHMKIKFRDNDEKLVVETSRTSAEDSLSMSEVDVAVLKEARILHFNAEVLLSLSMQSALFRAIKLSKKYNGEVFFDLNLPLPLWESRQQTWELIEKAWKQSNLIEVSKQELEFLLDEEYYEKKRNYRPQYYAESYEQTKNRRDYYHYSKEEIMPLWHDNIKILFVTDGTLRIHYYTPEFDGVVVGTEDVLITPFTCDRTGSGDAVVAGIMRKLTIHPEMYSDKDTLERHIRFAIAAGIISQWTIGAVRGFPTESATQNLKEQVYVPSMW